MKKMNELKQKKNDIKVFFDLLNHSEYTHFQVFLIDPEYSDQIHKPIRDRQSFPSKSYFIKDQKELIDLCNQYQKRGIICLGLNERDKGVTKISDGINKINLILFDLDIEKKNNGLASEALRDKAIEIGNAAEDYLRDKYGYTINYLADSGNGFHFGIKVSIDVPEYDGLDGWKQTDIYKRLDYLENDLANRFNTKDIKVDSITKDLARRVKVPGTFNVKRFKNDNGKYEIIPEFRRSEILALEINDNDIENNNKAFFDMEIENDNELDKYIPKDKQKKKRSIKRQKNRSKSNSNSDFNELLNKDQKFKDLYNGNASGYPSRSEMEIALIHKLLYYDFEKSDIFRIMDNSNIGKWSEKSNQYKQLTYDKAISKNRDLLSNMNEDQKIEYYEDKFKKRATYTRNNKEYWTKDFRIWLNSLENDKSDKKSKEDKIKEKRLEKYEDRAIRWLKNPNKFDIIKEILDSEIIEEDKNKMTAYLISAGAYLDLYQSGLFIGDPASGKTWIAKKVTEFCFPDEDVMFIADATPKSIHHKDLSSKRILVHDELQRTPESAEAYKSFDGGNFSFDITVEDKDSGTGFTTKTIQKKNIGLLCTTTDRNINDQLQDRSWIFEPNPQQDHTKTIINNKVQKLKYPHLIDQTEGVLEEKKEIVKTGIEIASKEASDYKVAIPYMDILERICNYNYLRIRRDFGKLEDIIKIITKLNYKNRDKFEYNGKTYLISNSDDLRIFFKYCWHIFSNITRNITLERQKILDLIPTAGAIKTKDLYDDFCEKEKYTKSYAYFRNECNALTKAGYLHKKKDGRSNIYEKRKNRSTEILTENKISKLIKESEKLVNVYDPFNEKPKERKIIRKKKKEMIIKEDGKEIRIPKDRSKREDPNTITLDRDRPDRDSDIDREIGYSINKYSKKRDDKKE